jgi:hypothetical protein
MRHLPILPLLALLAAAQAGPAGAARPVDHRPLSMILRDHVRNERVDYLGIRETQWAQLNAYLDSLARVDPLEQRGNNRLTYYINLYNATVIHAVIERLRAGYTVSENEHAFFHEPLVRMAGGRISLNELEHQRVRAEFPDPRIHTALVCAAVSCPPLLPRAYDRVDLDHTLTQNMRRFVMDTTRNRVDPAARKILLSSIFDWYAQDFQAHGGVRAYVESILPAGASGHAIGFLPYDWSLNIAAPRGEWVQARADGAALLRAPGGEGAGTARRGDLFRVIERGANALRIVRPFGAGEAWIAKGDAVPWRP